MYTTVKDEHALKLEEEAAQVYADFVKSFQPEEGSKMLRLKGFVRAGEALGFDANEEEQLIYPPNRKSFWAPPITTAMKKEQPPLVPMPPPLVPDLESASLSMVTPKIGSEAKQKEIDRVLKEMRERQGLLDQRRELRRLVAANDGLSAMERQRLKSDLERLELLCGTVGADVEETTNLYVGNLAPAITEQFLLNEFQKYGPVASVKIMYPRTADELARSRNCGFVSFVRRADAEEARMRLDGTEFHGMSIRIG
eukprot:Gregarina_sp_Poly_1__1503@NODE_1378_length_4263_cov_20_659676_g922_i0_p3_GENE_NODE_1378_length_4263_cov_20_659676_g922_i0NODE_1378_length_4263_cov_20_659676_g922_i0_p3_ORF_typecomplete_len254_score54_31RRM_1/PF00076_22/3_2e17RRM_5/PF13893_6/4_1e06RRM_occluded/PF16842_5/0_0019RRM_7/PF16367_5/0_013RAC_head/PF16717_5/8_5e02RAC_head/PF16717_5/0_089NRBF2/PF08961_10/2e03NRBF2/PF08961_10/0_02Limkainb1/PF11608_8/1_1e04Limkainb1/PF11608_8/0_057Nup35_RRM_2/PF14605_6/0_064Spc7/PF08317_11/0_14RRM_8/PF11835_